MLLVPLVLAAFAVPQLAAQHGGVRDPSWNVLHGHGVVVRFADDHDVLAEAVLRFLEEQAPLPGLPPDVPTEVSAFLAPDEASFQRLTGGRAPEWGAAVAIPARRMLVLPVYSSPRTIGGDRARVLRHEWAHLALHQYLDGLRVPRWFDEGYAEWAAGWDRSQAWRLRLLLMLGRAPALDSLALGWPRDHASARAAYLLSATAVEYLVRESGERALGIFLSRWRDGRSFEAALRATYGLTSGQLEEDWRAHVRDRYGWLLLFSQSMVTWSALTLLLLLLVLVRRRRDREHMARLRAHEVPELPAYWVAPEGAEPEWGAGLDRPPSQG